MKRCDWAEISLLELAYHDEEWGVPTTDDLYLFEMLILESAQAGLSWSTILKKRGGYQQVFDRFDPKKIAYYKSAKIKALMNNPSIVRNRAKIEATIINAKIYQEITAEHGRFANYIWSFVDGTPINNAWKETSQVPANTELSDLMSKSLKKRGFKFVGTTICYAFMQAVGMVNDHLTSCFRYDEILGLQEEFSV